MGCELEKVVCAKVLDSLAEVATTNVKKAGVFTIPGLCRLKIRTKPATKAGKRRSLGKSSKSRQSQREKSSKPSQLLLLKLAFKVIVMKPLYTFRIAFRRLPNGATLWFITCI